MSVSATAIPMDSTFGYLLPVDEVEATGGYAPTTQEKPSSTVNVADVFRALADEWSKDTGHMSLISQRINHPAYKSIIRMGKAAIPPILEDLKRRPEHWFHALITLADENPIPLDFNGTVDDAAALWVQWGRDNHFIAN